MKNQKKLSREEMKKIVGGGQNHCYATCNDGAQQVGPFGSCDPVTENSFCVQKYGAGSYAISCYCLGN